ncbi:IclR family transcriptional regulator [Haloarcula marina]|uniref:IclR family transcriptional regulator n=1 Tax=Haloarcula marina TaxID=2961574 RepID=UPI0020B69458|nr:IclR family transcriptional regulator [Halomicroarcula marina]
MPGNRFKNEVKSARTTFEILELLKTKDGATLTELTNEFELSKSSIHNYLKTLENDGYVVQQDNRYLPGLRLLDLGGFARHREQIYDIAKPEVEALAKKTGEMANLLVEQDGRGTYLYQAHGGDSVSTDSYIGQRVYLHNTALGKAILAHIPRDEVDEIVEKHGLPGTTEATVTDREALYEELDRIEEWGVAFDREERVKGLRCVAAPIVNNNDIVEGAISVSGPKSRMDEDRLDTLAKQLQDAINVIELNITYT